MRMNKLSSEILKYKPNQLKFILSYCVDEFFSRVNSDTVYPRTEVGSMFRDTFQSDGLNDESLMRSISDLILDKAIYKQNKRYFKFIDTGDSSVNPIACLINSLINQNMTSHLSDSPGATYNEISVLLKLRELIGYPVPDDADINIESVGGYFTSGGMMANTAALLVSRNNFFIESQILGLPEIKPKIIVSDLSHYSISNAVGWLGFGEKNVIQAPTKGFDYDIIALEKIVDDLYLAGEKVLMIVTTLGDPYSMSIQNISDIKKICERYNIWLHGDAANGGMLIFSKNYNFLIKDIVLCDSVSLDPHKSGGLNYPCSVFLCKDFTKFNSVISYWNIVNKKGSFDLGSITPFLNSRSFDSLKLWLSMKAYGMDGMAAMIDRKIETTRLLYETLKGFDNKIIFWNDPQTFSIVFQIVPKSHLKNIVNITIGDILEIGSKQASIKGSLERKAGIQVHNFMLPVKVKYPELNRTDRVEVLCIHNGHESIDATLIEKLKEFIKNYD